MNSADLDRAIVDALTPFLGPVSERIVRDIRLIEEWD